MNNFLAGFKNWRVIRVGIAYLVVAWLVVQLVNNIAGPLNLPGWTPTLVIVLLAVGFPIAVVVVAVSEFGQGGTKSEGLAPAAGTAKKLRVKDQRIPIAVLPLVNMSPTDEYEGLADVLTEDLITELAKQPFAAVAARTSSSLYKGKEMAATQIGTELGAVYVVEGSIRSIGESLRLTVQVISAIDGAHIWAQTAELALPVVAKDQDRILGSVASDVALSTVSAEAIRARSLPLNSLSPAELIRLAWVGRIHAAHAAAGFEERVAICQRALKLDPNFAPAHAMLAFCESVRALAGENDFDATMAGANSHREKAMMLDPRNPAVLMYLSIWALMVGNLDDEETIVEQLCQIFPFDPTFQAKRIRIRATRTGEIEPALEQLHELERQGGSLAHAQVLVEALYFLYRLAGKQEQAELWARRCLQLMPERWIGAEGLLHAAMLKGDEEAARDALKLMRRIFPKFSPERFAERGGLEIPVRNGCPAYKNYLEEQRSMYREVAEGSFG